MPALTVQVEDRSGVLTTGIDRRIDFFLEKEAKARVDAARKATEVSRQRWATRPNKRDPGGLGAFMGRETTGGRMGSFIRWRALKGGGVGLNLQELDSKAPHWIIQELGTGKRAQMHVGDSSGSSVTRLRTVKSQRGRRIPGGLVFASRGGVYSQPPGTGREQLYLRSMVTGAPVIPRGMRIRREIKGRNFVRQGGTQGFRQYRRDTLAAARRAFKKNNRI